ncbi:ABC transporter substrate-binding protein [Desulfoluna butyratoxydans]|uniref:Solute-binding protein family 3/n-terminal domain of mltf n=1 Tax=Desulfoluna butyratoxydans TaxID=231438 RepID=A0A4U8YK55_9BACT|nr:ABC transporter substrate-binding protein [Desulfoluna butyratoxydans]VFQ43734.1 solute-binding protein family 3/n-terminal domain of mltf [Desulfoluna butyratoxydans]
MKRIISALLASLFISGVALASDESLEKVRSQKEVVVGFCAQYPPFESKNLETGAFEGFDVDLARALAKEMGVSVRFVDAEWQGLLGGLGKGDFDMLLTCMSKSEARHANANFSNVYYRLADVIVVSTKNTDIKGLADLSDKTVGVQVGSGSEQLADGMKERFKSLKRYNYNPEAFADLKFGRIDAVLVGITYALRQNKVDSSFKVVGAPLAEAEIVAVMKKGADTLTGEVNAALGRLKASGEYAAIHDRWLAM